MRKKNEGVLNLGSDNGPLPDFDHFSARYPEIASSTNSLSRGEGIVDIKEGEPFSDEYFRTIPPDRPKRMKLKRLLTKKKEYIDNLPKIMKFKEYVTEGHRDIGGATGTMGFDQPPGSGMNVNPGGDITAMLGMMPSYVTGTEDHTIEDPYFNKDKSPIKDWKEINKKKKRRDYKYPEVDKIMKLKEFES